MEEQSITGVITKKEETSAPKDSGKDWKRFAFTIGDNFKGSTFDVATGQAYNIGDTVVCTYEKKGNFKNIIGMAIAGEADIKTAKESPKVDNDVWLEKDKRIVRQNCNARAIEFVRLLHDQDPIELKGMITTARGSLQTLVDTVSKHFENQVWK